MKSHSDLKSKHTNNTLKMVVNENCTNPPLMNLTKSLLLEFIKDKRALTHRLEIYIRKTKFHLHNHSLMDTMKFNIKNVDISSVTRYKYLFVLSKYLLISNKDNKADLSKLLLLYLY